MYIAKNEDIQVVGVVPTDGSSIPGIKNWPKDSPYLPKLLNFDLIDKTAYV